MQKMTEILHQVRELTCTLNPVEIYTADNIVETKKDFLDKIGAEDEFNPQLTYHNSLQKLEESLQEKNLSLEKIEQEINKLYAELKNIKLDKDDPNFEINRIAKFATSKKIK